MIRRLPMLLLATVTGYIAMILLITVSQEGLFGRISYYTTPRPDLLMSGALTFLSAMIGGAIAALIFGRPWYPPMLALWAIITTESTYMILAGRLEGPVWFDVMASGALLVGLGVGTYVVKRLRSPAASRALA